MTPDDWKQWNDKEDWWYKIIRHYGKAASWL